MITGTTVAICSLLGSVGYLLICHFRNRKQIRLSHKLNHLLGIENNSLNLLISEQEEAREQLQNKLDAERLNSRTMQAELRGTRNRQSKQNLMRMAMMNILNDAELAREEAESLSIVKGQFLANMSHEIRTPLNGIVGMNQLLASTGLSSEQREYIDTCTSAAESLVGIVNDILDYSKLEAGAVELDFHDFDLLKMIDEVVGTLSGRAVEKGIDIVSSVDVKVPTLLVGDSYRIKQVLLNLANNALRFTKTGEVKIQVRQLSRDGDNLNLRFSVIDTGIGIPDDKKSSLFKPFSQADGSTTRKYGGTGLGLVISKNLVGAMSGEIDFSSKENIGSEFWVDIPMSKQTRGKQMPFCMPPELIKKQFLLIDNRVRRREMLSTNLREWGCRNLNSMSLVDFQVHEHHAPEFLRTHEIVMVDSNLRINDFRTLASNIKTTLDGWKPKVVVICQWGTEAHWREEQGRSIDGILTTPIRQQSLVRRLSEACLNPQTQNGGYVKDEQEAIPPNDLQLLNPNILVVEDNRVNQKVILRMLQKFGCQTTCVEDGLQSLHAIEKNDYDVVLMDYQMPVMNGLDATKQIRKMKNISKSKTPIIGLTANAMQSDKEKAIAAGMDDYLTKPVVFKDLQNAISLQLKPQLV